MKIRPIKGLSEALDSNSKLPTPTTQLTGRLTYAELEEINNRITAEVVEALSQHPDYSPEFEREFFMDVVERMKTTPMYFGDFRMPPPKVTAVTYSPENGYTVYFDQNLPPIPDWVEIRASFNDVAFTNGVPSQEGDTVDIQGETFECEKTYLGKGTGTTAPFGGTPFNFNSDQPIDALMDYQVAGESKLKVKPSGEIIVAPGGPFFFAPMCETIEVPGPYGLVHSHGPVDGPRGPVGSPGAPGQPGIPEVYPTPTLLRSSSTKPLMYSVDVYKSLKDAQYVALSSFPIVGINDGVKIKPYAVGATVQDALSKLAESIRGWTGRKELGVINEHMHIDQWVCVHCHDVRGYPTRQELLDHINLRHAGNIGLEKYTNPAVTGIWLKLP